MCLFREENQQPVLGGNRFSEEVSIFIGRETKTVKQKHTFFRRKSTKKIAEVSPSNNKYSFRIISPFNNNNNCSSSSNSNSCLTQACPFLCGVFSVMMASEQPGSGAAQRRRQRRLRPWLRHERMTVAMALVQSTHHSSRGQTIARAGVWGREMNCTATIRDPPPHPSGSSSASTRKIPALCGRTGCLPCPDRKSGCAADGCAPVRRCACACCRAGY